MEEKLSKLKTTILTLLRLSEDETTIGTTALRLTGTNAAEGKKPHSTEKLETYMLMKLKINTCKDETDGR